MSISGGSVSSSALSAFFLFNPTLGEEATEGRKILFFYPPMDLNSQKDYVGLSEGLINFTKYKTVFIFSPPLMFYMETPVLFFLFVRDFSPDQAVETVSCEKNRHAFLEVEPDFWLVLVDSLYVFILKLCSFSCLGSSGHQTPFKDCGQRQRGRRCRKALRSVNPTSVLV